MAEHTNKDEADTDTQADIQEGTAIGGIGGAVAGAITGSIAGPVGTLAGAVIGGILGAAGSRAAVGAIDKIEHNHAVMDPDAVVPTPPEAETRQSEPDEKE